MHVGGGGAWRLCRPGERAARAAEAARLLATVAGETHPNVAAAAGELFAGTADDRFEFGLSALLDGFANRLAAAGSTVAGGADDDDGSS